ncbi:MAG: hypothetical protein A2W93_14140 [Bacteroidetes bacterium GWF2_43_63]|nr:MAG: hypothetical protein A2W94_00710 [Bacteroidetes bacterium GWE2_42_42]OFY52482.1 MAG: hypothetical protein A2W93_14140 [Bacteroidetes bacterium GWF2_43_63]HBG71387.1 hypothetical protein [Bacteroidales bacterium]HCB60861.1 hypothetical protein [Bacteroidales bacterium]HCY23414.1 hypothetical protein [Bacteroidales bacterium]
MTREEKLKYYNESKNFGYAGSFVEYWAAHTELLKEVGAKNEDKIPLAIAKQLVSGINIATINNQSLLGGGNITISSGGNSYFPSGW